MSLSIFTALAMYHLATYAQTPTYGVVAAVFWLALVIFVAGAALYVLGPRALFAVLLGRFSLRHFVEAEGEGGRIVIRFGFELNACRYCRFRVEGEQLIAVEMGTGQATELAQRDMDDWSVALWYRTQRRWHRSRQPRYHDDEDVYIVGASGPKQDTAQFLAVFIAFLRAAGVELRPGEGENEFLATPSD